MQNGLKRSHSVSSQELASSSSNYSENFHAKVQTPDPVEVKFGSLEDDDIKPNFLKAEPDSAPVSPMEPPLKKSATSIAKASFDSPRFNVSALTEANISTEVVETSKLSKFLKSDFQAAKFTDLSLKSSDGKVCKVHKVVVVPQSGFLTKTFEKTPKKVEIGVDCVKSILDAVTQYLYFDTYKVPATFQAEWKINDGKDNRSVEFTFKLHKAAEILEIESLKSHAINNIKKLLSADIYCGELCTRLQEVDKKKPEPPVGISEAVIATQALKVRHYIDVEGLPLNKAFHKASAIIRSEFLSDFIISVGDIMNLRFRTYLRCPNCASVIRNKSEKLSKFICFRNDCSKNQLEGELVPYTEV